MPNNYTNQRRCRPQIGPNFSKKVLYNHCKLLYNVVKQRERQTEREPKMKITVNSASIHLQGHGMQRAVPVEDLKPGMVTMWNWGETAEIEGIKSSKSGKTHQIVYKGGNVDHRKMRTGRLVAIA